jgi:hypothetical protein
MKAGLLAAWAAGMGIVVWRNVHHDHHMPVPGALLAITGLFATAAVVSDVWPQTTTLITVTLFGLDVAALLGALPAGLSGQISEATATAAKAEGVSNNG